MTKNLRLLRRIYCLRHSELLQSPKSADARRKTAKELAGHLDGAPDTAIVLGGFLNKRQAEEIVTIPWKITRHRLIQSRGERPISRRSPER